MRLLLPAAVASPLLIAHAVSAAVTLVSDSRSIVASASVSGTSGTSSQGPFFASPPGTGLRWETGNSVSAGAVVSGSASSAGAFQLSGWTIAGSLMLDAQGSASTSTTVTAASGGISALASASSILDVVFDVDAGTAISLQGSSSGVGVIRLDNLTSAQNLFTGFGFYNATLGPARIRLHAEAVAINNAPPGMGLGGGYSLFFNATPTPGAAPLLFCGTCLVARRRRS